MSRENEVFTYLKANTNFTNACIYGIMTVISSESSFNPTALGDNGTSYGLCQWHNGRWDKLKKYCKDNNLDVTKIPSQLSYLLYECKKYYKKVYTAFENAKNTENDLYNVAYTMTKYFEIPADTENTAKKRGNLAITKYGKNVSRETSSDKNVSRETKVDYAQNKSSKYDKMYKTISNLNLRTGASEKHEILYVMKKGEYVRCYGYYTKDWILVVHKETGLTGFCHKNFLKGVK